ncbi:hypothetical protein KEJ17_01450 [Candidatus Bathyarchaeota archaeon]|nr:hypothetical protein [Candidatus Bathyarchaeota archaeon]
MGKKTGQARLIELSLALVVLLIGFLFINVLNISIINTRSYKGLSNIANRILTLLDEKDTLYWMIYGEDGSGNIELSKKIIESVLPPSYGYNMTVYDEQWRMLWSISRGFDSEKSASGAFLYLTFNGEEQIRIVVLSISGGEG